MANNSSMNFKQIATYDNYMLANMTMGLFTENDIKCQMKDEHIITMDPLLNAAVGGIKLLVEEKDFDRAVALMKEAENDYLKDIPCPNCNSLSLIVEEKINNPTDFWGKLKNQVLFGQTSTCSKGYCCKACNKSFSELPPSF
jgi:regulatory protein YycI of two-component signal transduction system YycFG